MYCRNCGRELTGPGACPGCGLYPGDGVAYCPSCGSELGADAVFCAFCGTAVGKGNGAQNEYSVTGGYTQPQYYSGAAGAQTQSGYTQYGPGAGYTRAQYSSQPGYEQSRPSGTGYASNGQYYRNNPQYTPVKQTYNASVVWVPAGKDKGIAILLCLLFGYLGAHNFYLGESKKGLMRLFTAFCGLGGLLAVIDLVKMLLDKYNFDPNAVI